MIVKERKGRERGEKQKTERGPKLRSVKNMVPRFLRNRRCKSQRANRWFLIKSVFFSWRMRMRAKAKRQTNNKTCAILQRMECHQKSKNHFFVRLE
jgi:hypothetical protein